MWFGWKSWRLHLMVRYVPRSGLQTPVGMYLGSVNLNSRLNTGQLARVHNIDIQNADFATLIFRAHQCGRIDMQRVGCFSQELSTDLSYISLFVYLMSSNVNARMVKDVVMMVGGRNGRGIPVADVGCEVEQKFIIAILFCVLFAL